LLIAEPLQKVIDELSKLPSIGKKTAQRLALYLLKTDTQNVNNLAESLIQLKAKLRFCVDCFNISVEERCNICQNEKRDKNIICVVEEVGDIIAIEKTNEYKGLYHVLGGVLSPLSGVGSEDLKIKELICRLEPVKIAEVIIALNPDTEGETTAHYLARLIKPFGVKVTRIARGLPIGSDIEFADEATIGRAVSGRIDI
jgi:recombination protein RecR